MKRLLYIFLIFLTFSCGQNSYQEQEHITMDSSKARTTQTIDIVVSDEKMTVLDSVNSLEIFRNFALNYRPSKVILPEAPDSVLDAMRVVKTSNPIEFEEYLTLIFLKLCKVRLQCCRETYDEEVITLKTNSLVAEFRALTKESIEKRRIEFIPTRAAYHYIDDHQYLRSFRPINQQYNLIIQLIILEDI